MVALCFIPLVFAAYTFPSIQTPSHTSADIGGYSAEAQTCRDGVGARVAFGTQWVQVGPQYGYTIHLGDDWSVTMNIHGGLGYSNTFHPASRIRQVTKFNGGASVALNLGEYSIKIGYDHMSNGRGLDPTNHGQDMVSVGVGYSFH